MQSQGILKSLTKQIDEIGQYVGGLVGKWMFLSTASGIATKRAK